MNRWTEAARAEGYALRKALLDPTLIASMREAVLASIARHGVSDIVAVQCDIMPLEVVTKLRTNEQLLGALAEILEAKPAPLHADVLRIVPPGAPHTPPHMDADYLPNDPLWIAWIPLDDIPDERGPLVITPTTNPRVLPCTAGDVIFFSSRTEHATLPNTSALPRLSIDLRYGITQPR